MKGFSMLTYGVLVAACALMTPGIAIASCGSANCFLVTGTQEGIIEPGQIVVDLSYRYIPQDRKREGSSTADEVLVPKVNFAGGDLELNHHRELKTINMLTQLDVNYGVGPRLAIGATLPFSNERIHEHDDHVGEPEEVFSNQDGTSGMGDLAINAKYAAHVSTKHLTVIGAGLKFATGEYKLRDSDGGINEPTIMPGTGSNDFILSGYYAYQWQPHKLASFVSMNYRLTTENDLDYEFGDSIMLNTGINYIVTEKMALSGQLNVRNSGRDMFKGEGVPSTGGTFVYLTPGINLNASDNISLYTHLQLPLYQKVNEVNLVPSYGFMAGMSYVFSTL